MSISRKPTLIARGHVFPPDHQRHLDLTGARVSPFELAVSAGLRGSAMAIGTLLESSRYVDGVTPLTHAVRHRYDASLHPAAVGSGRERGVSQVCF
jgi:hypothetical protein